MGICSGLPNRFKQKPHLSFDMDKKQGSYACPFYDTSPGSPLVLTPNILGIQYISQTAISERVVVWSNIQTWAC